MKCQICGEREATIHLTEVVDEEIRKIDLCGQCAAEKGITGESGFGLADLLAGLSAEGGSGPAAMSCPRCGMTQEDFRRSGLLGCPDCYETFSEGVAALVRGMHHGDRHLGKAPAGFEERPEANPEADRDADREADRETDRGVDRKADGAGDGQADRETDREANRIEELTRRLAELVAREAFEEAAAVRDEILRLQGGET